MSASQSGRLPRADALVLFGATGDLAKRKLFPALYHMEDRGELNLPIIGVARSDWTDDIFRKEATSAIEAAVSEGQEDRAQTPAEAARSGPGRLRRPDDVGGADRRARQAPLADGGVLHGDSAVDVPDRRRVTGVGRAQRTRTDRRREALRA